MVSGRLLVKISNSRQNILIEALKTYRDKLKSMMIDYNEVQGFLDDFRKEKNRIEQQEVRTDTDNS